VPHIKTHKLANVPVRGVPHKLGSETGERKSSNCPKKGRTNVNLKRHTVWVGIAAILTAVALCAEEANQTVAATNSYTEQFKAFLASPPAIANVVFRKKLRRDLHQPEHYDGSFEKSTNSVLYRGSWQHDALLLFQPTNETGGLICLPGKTAVSIFSRKHQLLEGGRYLEVCDAPFGTFDNSITIGIYFCVSDLNQVLQGGVAHLRPGNIKWIGNSFEAEDPQSPEKPKFRVKGVLVEDKGRPKEMIVTYSTGNSSTDTNVRWCIRYFYEGPLDIPFFPSRIRAFALLESRELELADIKIATLKQSNAALPHQSFDLTPLLRDHPTAVAVFTNNALHQVLADGSLRKLETRRPQMSLRQLNPSTALGALCGLNILLLASFWKIHQQQKTKNKMI
jgi:hypothetical protein